MPPAALYGALRLPRRANGGILLLATVAVAEGLSEITEREPLRPLGAPKPCLKKAMADRARNGKAGRKKGGKRKGGKLWREKPLFAKQIPLKTHGVYLQQKLVGEGGNEKRDSGRVW